MSCYPVIPEESVRGSIFKSYNFEKSIILLLKDGTTFVFLRFDKITLRLQMMNDFIPVAASLVEVIEYNEFLALAVVEVDSNNKQLKIWRNKRKNIETGGFENVVTQVLGSNFQ